MVYVISKDGKPLMPCENVIARLLLKSGKAKVKRREPFTIKLLYETTHYTQPLTCGVDTGSGTAGFAVSDDKGHILYASEVELRNDIKGKMTERRQRRRTRRNRKTRYRKPRFDNRKNSTKEGRIPPTVKSKINSHEKEIKCISKILPITKLALEVGNFDPRQLKEPWIRNENIIHWGYQKGPNYGYENTRMMVLARDKYTCQHCKGKNKDSRLEVHHIQFRSKGGSDDAQNLMTLCHTCHTELHKGKFKLKETGIKRGTLSYATQMNIIRSQLIKNHPNAEITYGYITSANRKALGLRKTTHWMDACIIATGGKRPRFAIDVMYKKKCVPEGDFKRTKGQHSEIRLPKGKVCGFNRFDKVRYLGHECFIKGRMQSGYAALMDIDGKTVDFSDAPKGMKTPKFSNLKRLAAHSSWMVTTVALIPNTILRPI